jgi:hypothetical protein
MIRFTIELEKEPLKILENDVGFRAFDAAAGQRQTREADVKTRCRGIINRRK